MHGIAARLIGLLGIFALVIAALPLRADVSQHAVRTVAAAPIKQACEMPCCQTAPKAVSSCCEAPPSPADHEVSAPPTDCGCTVAPASSAGDLPVASLASGGPQVEAPLDPPLLLTHVAPDCGQPARTFGLDTGPPGRVPLAPDAGRAPPSR